MDQGPAGAAVSCTLILMWISVTFAAHRLNSYAGPFEVHFREALECPAGTITGPLWMNMSGTLHYSRALNGMVYDGVLRITKRVDWGLVGIKLAIAKWDRVAGWKENFFKLDAGELCASMKTIGPEVMGEIHRLLPRVPKECPIPDETYVIRNFSTTVLSRYNHFPVFPYGRFKGDLAFYEMKSKLVVACISGASDVVPKVNTRNKT